MIVQPESQTSCLITIQQAKPALQKSLALLSCLVTTDHLWSQRGTKCFWSRNNSNSSTYPWADVPDWLWQPPSVVIKLSHGVTGANSCSLAIVCRTIKQLSIKPFKGELASKICLEFALSCSCLKSCGYFLRYSITYYRSICRISMLCIKHDVASHFLKFWSGSVFYESNEKNSHQAKK